MTSKINPIKSKIAKPKQQVKGKNKVWGSDSLKQWTTEQTKEAQQTAPGQNKKPNSWKIRLSQNQWRDDMKKLTPVQRCILIDLRFYARTENKAWPSIPTIAKNINTGESTIKRQMPSLIKKRFIKITKKLGRNNLYKLNIKF